MKALYKKSGFAAFLLTASAFALINGCGGVGSTYNTRVTTGSVTTGTTGPKTTGSTTTTTTTGATTGTTTGGCTDLVAKATVKITVKNAAQAASGTFSDVVAGTYTATIPAGGLAVNDSVTAGGLAQSQLPVVNGSPKGYNPAKGDVYVSSLQLDIAPITVTSFAKPLTLTSAGLVPGSIAVGTTLHISVLQNCKTTPVWVDVATAQVTAKGVFVENLPSSSLPGILAGGTYVLYKPLTSTTVANYGAVLFNDDGLGTTNGLQVVHLYDKNGNILSTPTYKMIPIANASDLDGLGLTPDGSEGIIVDGGNTLRFFSSLNTGTPVISSKTLDISSYGGDGDSVAILPDGNTSVADGDNGAALPIITGIAKGSPIISDSIANPQNVSTDGMVIANDGSCMLVRGYAGIFVYAITPTSPTKGPLGGTENWSFKQVAFLAAPTVVPQPYAEDGRDAMAFSPTNPSTAVVAGLDANSKPVVQLLTGLPNHPAIARTLRMNVPPSRVRSFIPKLMGSERPQLNLKGTNEIYAVAISNDGTKAYVSIDSGIVVVGGVNSGALTQLSDPAKPSSLVFSPAVPGGLTQTGNLMGVTTMAVTLDGKYLVVGISSITGGGANIGSGALLVYPITSNWLGSQVASLSGTPAIPYNDQMVSH